MAEVRSAEQHVDGERARRLICARFEELAADVRGSRRRRGRARQRALVLDAAVAGLRRAIDED
jgi:hypothetical protein